MKWHKRRWTERDVNRALALMAKWESEHPGEVAWFAASPTEEAEVRAYYEGRGRAVTVVPVYPGCSA